MVISLKPNTGASNAEVSNAIAALFSGDPSKAYTPPKSIMETVHEINKSQENQQSINEQNIKRIIFDMSEIEFISSTAYNPILKAHNFLKEKLEPSNDTSKSKRFVKYITILNPKKYVKNLIRTTQTDTLFDVRE